MATLRSDLRTEIRDNIQEVSGVQNAIWSDTLLNRHISREIQSLHNKNIFKEAVYSATLDSSTDYSSGIVLPTGTVKIEELERNDGTSTNPDWNPLLGVDNYAGALFLPFTITNDMSIRGKLKKKFTVPSDDVTALDVPDDVCEVVVWGVTIRCFKMLIGYLANSKSWDSVTKPGNLQITSVQNWIRDAEKYYQDLVKQYATNPRPRDIDLTS